MKTRPHTGHHVKLMIQYRMKTWVPEIRKQKNTEEKTGFPKGAKFGFMFGSGLAHFKNRTSSEAIFLRSGCASMLCVGAALHKTAWATLLTNYLPGARHKIYNINGYRQTPRATPIN